MPLRPSSFDGALGHRIIALHVWAVQQGLRGVPADLLFDGFCRRLGEAGVPLWRGFAALRTLHPQWGGYGYVWRRDVGAVRYEYYKRGSYESGGEPDRDWLDSPFAYLIGRAAAGGEEGNSWPSLRRRLGGPEAELDFPVLAEFAAAGGTDYFAEVLFFGARGDPSHGSGVGLSFTTDRPEGFAEDDIQLLQAVLPAVALAMMTDACHRIASGLLATYLGEDAGRRVHTGAVARGSVESIRAVLWYADIRSFTAIADNAPAIAVVEMLDEVFEALAAALRRHGGQVLKFLGDGMLAIFPLAEPATSSTCSNALAAAAEAMAAVDRLNAARKAAGKPVAAVDLALHLGDVLYGNVGAVDRLDFTVIGPAVNEAARIETLCEPLGERVLVSAELAAATAGRGRLRPLGRHPLRGVREEREIYALELTPPSERSAGKQSPSGPL
jgi:adenylate cyclase